MTAIPGPGTSDELSILLSIYSADRAQAATTIGTIATVTVAGVGYIAVAAGILFASSDVHFGLWTIAVPIPAWALFLFQLHLGSLMIARTQSILRIESRFAAFGAYASLPAHGLGQNAEERLTNMHVQPKSLWLGGVFSYALEPILLGGLTVVCLLKAVTPQGVWGGWAPLGWIGYVGLFAASVAQFGDQARRLRETSHLLM